MTSLAIDAPAGLRVQVTCTDQLAVDAGTLTHYVPGGRPANGPPPGRQVNIDVRAGTPGVQVNGDQVTLSDDDLARAAGDLPHMVGAVAKGHLIGADLWPIHAAAVRDDHGHAVLLVGHSATGKTSAALACERLGWPPLSTNTSLLAVTGDGLRLVAGTRTVAQRQLDMPGRWRRWQIDDPAAQLPCPVGKVAYVHVGHPPGRETLAASSALHQLFPRMTDPMNIDCVVAGGHGLLTFDLRAAKLRLLPALRDVISRCRHETLGGSAEQIAEALRCE